jgi:hypothetical protein
MPSLAEVEAARATLVQRRGNFALLRFAMIWLFVISVVGLFVPSTMIAAIFGVLVAVVLFLSSNETIRQADKNIAAFSEYLLFSVADGQQAIRAEASRRLREGDY